MQINMNLKAGFTLVEIMIVTALIGLLASIAIPNFIKARAVAQRSACINNLRQIDGAKEQYAVELKLGTAAPIDDTETAFLEFFKGQELPTCPADGGYKVEVVGVNPSCGLLAAPDLHVLPN